MIKYLIGNQNEVYVDFNYVIEFMGFNNRMTAWRLLKKENTAYYLHGKIKLYKEKDIANLQKSQTKK